MRVRPERRDVLEEVAERLAEGRLPVFEVVLRDDQRLVLPRGGGGVLPAALANLGEAALGLVDLGEHLAQRRVECLLARPELLGVGPVLPLLLLQGAGVGVVPLALPGDGRLPRREVPLLGRGPLAAVVQPLRRREELVHGPRDRVDLLFRDGHAPFRRDLPQPPACRVDLRHRRVEIAAAVREHRPRLGQQRGLAGDAGDRRDDLRDGRQLPPGLGEVRQAAVRAGQVALGVLVRPDRLADRLVILGEPGRTAVRPVGGADVFG